MEWGTWSCSSMWFTERSIKAGATSSRLWGGQQHPGGRWIVECFQYFRCWRNPKATTAHILPCRTWSMPANNNHLLNLRWDRTTQPGTARRPCFVNLLRQCLKKNRLDPNFNFKVPPSPPLHKLGSTHWQHHYPLYGHYYMCLVQLCLWCFFECLTAGNVQLDFSSLGNM